MSYEEGMPQGEGITATMSTKLQNETADRQDKCTTEHPEHHTTCLPTLFEFDKSWQLETGITWNKQTDADF